MKFGLDPEGYCRRDAASLRMKAFDLAYIDQQPSPQAEPILLIHGFASSHMVNWVSTGWVKTLNDAGYRTVAFDNRGHGASTKSYEPADYTPHKMAGDASALLDHLGIRRAHVMGYSMGARISAYPGARRTAKSCDAGLWRAGQRPGRRRRRLGYRSPRR